MNIQNLLLYYVKMTAGELVNPPKLPSQVLFESRLSHELYVKSHEDYHPGEHINRKNNILGACVPEDHTFGVGTSSIYGVAELLRTCKSSSEKKDLMVCLEHINKLRQLLKNKNPPFEFDAFLKALQYFDQENIRWIPIDVVQKTCQFFELSLHKEKLETIMKQIGIMRCDGCVEYKKFCELLNWRYEFPDIGKIVDIPPEKQYYNTTYNVFARNQQCDGSDNLDVHPSNTCNCVLYPIKENEAVNVSEADIKTLISPSIFSQYGVTPEDFFKPRDKETIYNIFTHIGVKLPDDLFESIWNEAYQCDESGGVCVETFRNILDKLVAEHAKTE
ncbi:EF-hand domain-containing family member B-like isoform X2 [Periplaneta americana]|uniref:EF-hand domain-containing family member B-like isoform X2 n=1 Tax=Periplaneta americana TaxID=6978 RepID=UPI0037E7B975